MNDWTNHPSYDPNAGRCLEQDLSTAIQQSITLGGQSVGVAYSDAAVDMLREWCEWESDETYSFRGVEQDGDREWRVHLLEVTA